MRRTARVLLTVLCILLPLCGCGKNDTDTSGVITDMKIPAKDVTEFYYTYENINYGAFYRRYRLYTENGKYFFFHETRERPEDYGPATEEDVTASGTTELSPEEWAEFLALLKDGKVTKIKYGRKSPPSSSAARTPHTDRPRRIAPTGSAYVEILLTPTTLRRASRP